MRLWKFLLIGVFPLTFLLILALLFLGFPRYLSLEKKVKANTLVVEGWMPEYGLQTALEEYKNGDYDYVLITGGEFRDFITLYINSFLIFYPHQEVLSAQNENVQLFELQVGSSLGKNDSAHFVLWINDRAVLSHYTNQQQGIFAYEWEGELSGSDSLMIQFDNDMVGELGDRNLRIKSLTLNGMSLTSETSELFLDRGRPFGKFRWNLTATSYAELAAHYFINRGIESHKIIPVTNYYFNLRRTYGNALALKEWIEKNDPAIKGINIVSMDYHSRRTWLIYRRLLKDNSEVGIISSPNLQQIHLPRKRYEYIGREAVAMIYYKIFILPWV